MMLGRRGFLKAIGAGVLGIALALRAPEVKKPDLSFSIRFAQSWDPLTFGHPVRFDVLGGYGVARPDWPIRIVGA